MADRAEPGYVSLDSPTYNCPCLQRYNTKDMCVISAIVMIVLVILEGIAIAVTAELKRDDTGWVIAGSVVATALTAFVLFILTCIVGRNTRARAVSEGPEYHRDNIQVD